MSLKVCVFKKIKNKKKKKNQKMGNGNSSGANNNAARARLQQQQQQQVTPQQQQQQQIRQQQQVVGGTNQMPNHLMRGQNTEFQRQYAAQQELALQQLQRLMTAMTTNGTGNNRQGPAVQAVTEGRTISNECAVNTHTVKFDKDSSTITFDIVNNVACEVEVHVAVRLDVYQGIVFATPNRQRAPPKRVLVESPNKEGRSLSFVLDEHYFNIPVHERAYSMHAPKQFPVVISVLYQHEVDKDGHDKKSTSPAAASTTTTETSSPAGGGSTTPPGRRSPGGSFHTTTPQEQLQVLQSQKKAAATFNAEEARERIYARRAEHTCLQLDPHLKVVRQFFELEGGTYLVEHLYGGEHEARVVNECATSGVDGEAETGAVMEAGSSNLDADGDDDDTCVICLTEERNTAVMPCRHLCLCRSCADELRKHTPKCPVCRGPIQQLLSMKKKN